jgi:hypothetical protein
MNIRLVYYEDMHQYALAGKCKNDNNVNAKVKTSTLESRFGNVNFEPSTLLQAYNL